MRYIKIKSRITEIIIITFQNIIISNFKSLIKHWQRSKFTMEFKDFIIPNLVSITTNYGILLNVKYHVDLHHRSKIWYHFWCRSGVNLSIVLVLASCLLYISVLKSYGGQFNKASKLKTCKCSKLCPRYRMLLYISTSNVMKMFDCDL